MGTNIVDDLETTQLLGWLLSALAEIPQPRRDVIELFLDNYIQHRLWGSTRNNRSSSSSSVFCVFSSLGSYSVIRSLSFGPQPADATEGTEVISVSENHKPRPGH